MPKWRSLAILLLSAGTLQAAGVIYDESVDGDFSDNYLSPTPVTLGLGSNLMVGRLAGATSDLDLFTVTILPGQELVSLRIIEFFSAQAENLNFLGVQPGPTLTTNPFQYIGNQTGPAINYVLFGGADAVIDRDVMPQLVVGLPLAGQSPLPAGEYAFWMNETRAASDYTLSFDVVPEPGTAVLLGLAGVALGTLRRRRIRARAGAPREGRRGGTRGGSSRRGR